MMRSMITFITMLLAMFMLAKADIGPPIPPPGLFCCPPCGPKGLHLDRQQVGPFAIFCDYSPGNDESCIYDPGTGQGGTQSPGCPTQAPSNPHPPSCPI